MYFVSGRSGIRGYMKSLEWIYIIRIDVFFKVYIRCLINIWMVDDVNDIYFSYELGSMSYVWSSALSVLYVLFYVVLGWFCEVGVVVFFYREVV